MVSGAFPSSWVWLYVPTASQSQGFSWLHLLLNSNAWGYSCQGCGGHVGLWQYPTYVSKIKWLIHKENLSHSRSPAEAECWLDCKHPFNGWTHCNHRHFKQLSFGVWARVVRQDEEFLVLCTVRSGVWKLSMKRVAPALCPRLPGGLCSSAPAHPPPWPQGGSPEGKSAKVRCEVFGLFMAETLKKMEENVLSAFLEENCNFLMFRVYFFQWFFFFLKERKPETLLKSWFSRTEWI